MALVPYPPTSAAFLATASKPEAFTGNPSASPPVPGIPTATIDAVLREVADDAAAMAFSDRRTLPLLQVDEGFQGHVFALAARRLMGHRGYNPKVGVDEEIVEQAKRADEYLEACGPGAGGKRLTPMVVDSKQDIPQDRVGFITHHTADWWARSRFDQRGKICR